MKCHSKAWVWLCKYQQSTSSVKQVGKLISVVQNVLSFYTFLDAESNWLFKSHLHRCLGKMHLIKH
jgi:hypothetical protein